MTPRECLLKAAECDQMARASVDHFNTAMLREIAKHWRNLAETAKKLPGDKDINQCHGETQDTGCDLILRSLKTLKASNPGTP